MCIIHLRRALKHAASVASRLDTRPHTPRGIIALHIRQSIDPRRRCSRRRHSRLLERRRTGENRCRRTRKEKGPVVVGLKRNVDREWRAKTKTDRNRTLREGEKVCGTIIDLPLERARSRWLYLKITGGKKRFLASLRAFLRRLFLLLKLGSSRRTVLSVRYTRARWRAKRVRELSCAWRVRNAVVINVAYEW